MAGMTCHKTGERSRPIYGIHVYRGRKGEKKGFGRQDCRDLIVRAHMQLGGPIVLVRDNLSTHLVLPMKAFIAANEDWLTAYRLPTYAPGLNPQEGIWSLVKRGIGNLAPANLDHLTKTVKRKLKKIQYRAHLIDACLTETALIMDD